MAVIPAAATVRRQDGFTLVELMMATAITLIILATATGTFRNALVLNDTATVIVDSNQNLRVGSNALVRDLMQAGRGIPTGGIPIPSGAGVGAINRPAPPATPAVPLYFNNTTQTTLTAVVTGYQLGPVINGRRTDMVTMLALDPTSYVEFPAGSFKQMPLNTPLPLPTGLTAPVPALAADGASLTVGQFGSWLTDPVSGVKAGDILLFNNVNGTAIQTVTGVSGTTVSFASGDPFNFNQRGAPQGSILQIRGGTTFPATDVVRIQMLTYYLDAQTVAGAPRLTRRVNFNPAQALAGVIDDLTITYDLVDSAINPVNPVDQPTLPVTIGSKAFSANQIRKANLKITVRSEAKSSVQPDYLRTTTNTVVSLRSLAYIDRYK